MEPDDTRETSREIEEASAEPREAESSTVEQVRRVLTSGLNRRNFLAAAALGSAAAAFVQKTGSGLSGVRLGPLPAFADNLSGLNCTANDVRIVGPGIILNEPCDCTGTFNAQVQFRVINNTGTTRYCVKVHFCPGTNGFDPGDILIGDIPRKSDALYTVTIPNYPCGSGLVCFGACGPGVDEITGLPDCSFPKGTPCPAGQCCTTISWDVNPGCPASVITSKCRHQQVCIQGRGGATLDCNTSLAGVQTNCAVECGATTTVRLCTSEAASFGPFTFVLHVPGQPDQTFTGPGPCHDFTVGPITATTTITGDVTSNDLCKKSASVTLTTTPVAAPIVSAGIPDCNGAVTFAVTNCNSALTYTFQEVTDCSATGTTIGLSQTVAGCPASATFTFAPGATDTTHCVRCDGVVTLVATASGGVPPYSFVFNGATGVVSGTGNTRTIVIQPILDGVCHSVTVTVTDSRGCSATSAAVSWSSCVTTTICP